MNTKNIGNYIQTLRKQKGLSQKGLAELLSVTFQAVSKWENGENLPDASILLDLADILDTTTDKILSGGQLVIRKNRKVDIEKLKTGIVAIENLKSCFGEYSTFYKGAIEGINNKMNFDIENCFIDESGKELLLAEAVIQSLLNGYSVDEADIDEHFSSEAVKRQINKYRFDCSLFSSQATNYKNYRPSYPSAVMELILSQIESPIIADIGSGTGKLSKLLVEGAKTLYSIEPNRQMRKSAEDIMSCHDNYISIASFAEQTTLPDSSVDIITVAESFHWFDNEKTHAEMRRILKKDGYVFLLCNVFGGDEFDKEMSNLKISYRAKKNQKTSGISYRERANNLFGENSYNTNEFDNSMEQTFEEFCGGMLSTSFAPDKTSEDYERFINDVKAIFDKYSKNGKINTTITTVCYWGRL